LDAGTTQSSSLRQTLQGAWSIFTGEATLTTLMELVGSEYFIATLK
jgi:hypothetical protein